MTIATRDVFLQAAKRRFKEINVSGLGVIRIRNLSAGEKSRIETDTYRDNQSEPGSGTTRWKARIIMASVVDLEGNQLITDIDTVMAVDSAIADQLFEVISLHCEATETIEEQEKN